MYSPFPGFPVDVGTMLFESLKSQPLRSIHIGRLSAIAIASAIEWIQYVQYAIQLTVANIKGNNWRYKRRPLV